MNLGVRTYTWQITAHGNSPCAGDTSSTQTFCTGTTPTPVINESATDYRCFASDAYSDNFSVTWDPITGAEFELSI
jgi:hypothetical protein